MTSEKFTRVPNYIYDLIFKSSLTLAETRVYLLIIRRTYGFNRKTTRLSNGFIAREISVTERTANRAVKALEKKGFIKIHNKGGGGHNAREVSVNPSRGDTDVLNRGDIGVGSRGDTDVMSRGDTDVLQETTHIKNTLEKNKEREIAFLESLPERLRVLDTDDLESEGDVAEWIDRRDAWEAEHGEIYREEE